MGAVIRVEYPVHDGRSTEAATTTTTMLAAMAVQRPVSRLTRVVNLRADCFIFRYSCSRHVHAI